MLPKRISPVNVFFPSVPSTDVERILRPLLIWMRLISIDLPIDRKPTKCRQSLSWIYLNLAWLLTFMVHLSSILYTALLFKNPAPTRWGTTLTWNVFIDIANMTCHSVAVHTSVYLFLVKRWNKLQQNLITSEQYNVRVVGKTKIQYFCLFGVFYIISMVKSVIFYQRSYFSSSITNSV